MNLLLGPAIPLLGIYPKGPKTLIPKNITTPMFTEALYTTAKIWKKHKCPQLWNIYIMEYYSAVKDKKSFTLCNSVDGPGEHYIK